MGSNSAVPEPSIVVDGAPYGAIDGGSIKLQPMEKQAHHVLLVFAKYDSDISMRSTASVDSSICCKLAVPDTSIAVEGITYGASSGDSIKLQPIEMETLHVPAVVDKHLGGSSK